MIKFGTTKPLGQMKAQIVRGPENLIRQNLPENKLYIIIYYQI